VAFNLLDNVASISSNEKENSMTNHTTSLFRSALMLLTAASFMIVLPATSSAKTMGDSQEVSKLLLDAKSEAVELREDAEKMATLVRSKVSWQSLGVTLDQIKEHVNKNGRLLAQLQEARATGSPWQQQAIDHITPLLTELAANTTATIEHLNVNRSLVHRKELSDYCKTNSKLATELAALVADFVDYGATKATLAELQKKVDAR
jgi:hypothetical protein